MFFYSEISYIGLHAFNVSQISGNNVNRIGLIRPSVKYNWYTIIKFNLILSYRCVSFNSGTNKTRILSQLILNAID